MDRRLGWEVERLILVLLISMGLLDFAGLLTPFWAYIMDLVGWTTIAYIIYAISPTELLFGERHAHADLTIVSAYIIMSVKDLVGNAAATLPELYASAASYIKLSVSEPTASSVIFALTSEEFTRFEATARLPARIIEAIAPQFNAAQQQIPLLLMHGQEQVALLATPTSLSGSMLMFYSTLVQHAAIIHTVSLIAGMLLLIGVSIFAAYRIQVRKPSVLSVLREEGEATALRPLWVFLVLVGFFIIVFNLLFEWMTITNDAPLIALAVVVLGTMFFFHHISLSKDQMIERLGTIGDELYSDVLHLFMQGRTILLGISGFLVLHLITDVGNYVAPAIFGWYETLYVRITDGSHEPVYSMIIGSMTDVLSQDIAVVAAYVLSTVGLITLLVLPAVMWYKMFKIRTKSHEHLPDWKGWQVGIVLAVIAVFLIVPVFGISAIRESEAGLVGVNLTSLPIGADRIPLVNVALIAAGAVFLLVAIIGLHDYARRVLMLLPFGAAAVFFGIYIYNYFVSSFIYYASSLVKLLSGGLSEITLVPIMLVMFMFTILFYVTGFVSFIYEIWRD